jgi:hypothetical protein
VEVAVMIIFGVVRIHFSASFIWAQHVKLWETCAMCAYNFHNGKCIFDPKWVADEYLRRCKAGKWKKGGTLKVIWYQMILWIL